VLINDNPGTHPPGGAGRAELCCPEPCLATNRVDGSGSRRNLPARAHLFLPGL